MSTFAELKAALPDTAEVVDGHLHIGGCDTVRLAAEYGTPLFVFCPQTLLNRVRLFKQGFPEATIYYAAKAFLTKAVCRILEVEGLGLDVASGGELHTALVASFPPERMVMHGNNKSDAEITAAVDAGLGRIAVDNLEEIDRIGAAAHRAGRVQAIFVRVTPGVEADTHKHIITGHHESKFGLSIASGAAAEAINTAIAHPDVDLAGIHCHIGSNICSAEPFEDAIDILFDFLGDLYSRAGIQIKQMNLGGGFGVPFVAGDEPFDPLSLGDAILNAAHASAEEHGLQMPQLCFEPGRWLIGNSMVTLYSVGAIKHSMDDLVFVSVDGGMSDNIRPALYQASYEALLANNPDDGHTRAVTVAGMHCESGDVLAEGVQLPVETGRSDVVAMPATGAYAYSMASNYNKKPRPAVVTASGGRASVMVRRETYEDLIRLEEDP
ncbi:MAG: diaminopimelate decarboxylase [Actinomycetota bacterium]